MMSRPGPTLDPSAAPWLPAWVLAGGLLLWPQPALASAFDGGPQWIGAGIALGLFLLLILAATWILRTPSPPDMESGTGVVTPAPAALPPTPIDFSDSRLGRLQQGLGRRRRGLQEGQRGFLGDTEVMARFLEGCARMQRGEAPPIPPGRQLPPGALARLTRLYDQLLSAKPARARDWPLQRASLSSQIRTILGQRDTLRFLELLDGLAKRRVDRQQPTEEEATAWSDFLAQFRDTPAAPAPLASAPDAELAIAEDVPTSELGSLDAIHAELEGPPTVDTDLLSPGSANAEGAPTVDTHDHFPGSTSAEDAPTVDTDHLFPGKTDLAEEDAPTVDTDDLFPGKTDLAEEDAPTVDTDDLFPGKTDLAEEDAPTVDTDDLFPGKTDLAEEDAPTVDTDDLFPGKTDVAEGDAPTVDTHNLFPARAASQADADDVDLLPLAEEDAPTVDTENLFPTRKISISEDDDDRHDDAPTVDTFRLFGATSLSPDGASEGAKPSARRRRRRAKPTRASFTETDELLDPVDDAPTRDTADLFPKE